MGHKAQILTAYTIFFSCLVGCVSAPQKENPTPPSSPKTAEAAPGATRQAPAKQQDSVKDWGPESGAGTRPADAAQAPKEATVRESKTAVVAVVEEKPSAPAAAKSPPIEAAGELQPPVDPKPSPVIAEPASQEQLEAEPEEKAGDAEITEVVPTEPEPISETNVLEGAASEQDAELASYDPDVEDPTSGMKMAMIEEPLPPTVREPDPATMVFDEEHLPVEFDGGWVLDKRSSLVDGKIECLILSPWAAIFDGYDKTEIQIQVADATVAVRSKSNLDSSYEQQGLVVDGGELFTFESSLVNEQTTYTKGPVQAAMANGRTLGVAIGFWPTWPVTTTQHTSIDLFGFPQAYEALRACVKQ